MAWLSPSEAVRAGTSQVPWSAIISMASWSRKVPCSIERTPPRIAALIPALPCACAMTKRPAAAGPAAIRDQFRGTLRLKPQARRELTDRLHALLDEFSSQDDPDGEPLSLLWIMHAAPRP